MGGVGTAWLLPHHGWGVDFGRLRFLQLGACAGRNKHESGAGLNRGAQGQAIT